MRKMDRFDRAAAGIVGRMVKEHRKIQGVKPLPQSFWIRMWDEIHQKMRGMDPGPGRGELTDFIDLGTDFIDLGEE